MRTTNPAKCKSLEVTEKVIFPDATEQTTAAVGVWTEIGDTILDAPAASVEFAAIPAGYAAFLLLYDNVYGDNAAIQGLSLTFNEDSGNNYDVSRKAFNQATATGGPTSAISLGNCGDTDDRQLHSCGDLLIFNRAAIEKLVRGFVCDTDKGGANVEDSEGYHVESKWRNVADEISTITITPSVGNFVAGSRFILMGVKT